MAALGAGMFLLTGCNSGGHTLGAAPPSEGNLAITRVADIKMTPTPITVHGTMIEKCPVAGCWFMLRDKTGVIKVDTKGAGFVVSEVPVNTEVTVTGVPGETGEKRIAATGIRY